MDLPEDLPTADQRASVRTDAQEQTKRLWTERLIGGFARWLEPEENPAGVVYGTIAVGAVLATESTVRETFRETIAATVVTLVLYWLAHTYALVVGMRVQADRSLSVGGILRALAHEWAIVKGATIPVVVLFGCWAGGVSLRTAVTAGLWASAASLASFEVVAAVRSGRRSRRIYLEAIFGTALGGGLLLLHASLH